MRALTIALISLGLTSGVALADHPRDEVRVEHYRDFHARPGVRFERHDERGGYRWVGGEWRWNRGEWIWAPGYYVRITR